MRICYSVGYGQRCPSGRYFAGIWPHLDEHARRLVAASKAVELGYGGISRVSRACGLSRVTLTKGVEQLQAAPLVRAGFATRAAAADYCRWRWQQRLAPAAVEMGVAAPGRPDRADPDGLPFPAGHEQME